MRKFTVLVLTVALAATVYFGVEITSSLALKNQLEHRQTLISRALSERHAIKAPRKSNDGDLPERKSTPIQDPYTIELEAIGVKLKIVNESTWTAVFKLCFLWAFLLLTIAVYRRFAPAASK